jgi:hypothetical protein
MKNIKTTIISLAILAGVCTTASAASGYGISNVFTINNRDSITVNAVNNWDGTVTVTWTERGGVRLVRQEVGNTSNETGWSVNGNYFNDTFQPSAFKKKYVYIVRNLSGTELGRSGEVMPDVVVVLVRGYDPAMLSKVGIDTYYWKSDTKQQAKGLVANVSEWFSDLGLTCWDASSVLDGKKSIVWNSNKLKNFITDRRTGSYADAKINLVAHSMGGLTSREYVNEQKNENIVNNIFCIQTPHTGSPLSEKIGWWPWESDAKQDLYIDSCETFNKNRPVPRAARLYCFYSNNWKELLGGYKISNGIINDSPYFTQVGEQSDGAVPYLSGLGRIYEKETFGNPAHGTYYELWSIKNKVYPIADTMNIDFDHSTGYRHPNTLNKILEWLGLPYDQSKELSIFDAESKDSEEFPLYYITGFTGEIDSNNPASEIVIISDSSRAVFRAVTSDANTDFTLEDPFGVIYDPDYAEINPDAVYEQVGDVAIYEVNAPVAGEWLLHLTTATALPDFVTYGLTVFEDHYVAFSVTGESDWINTGQTMLLTAEIADNSGAVTGASVNADITLPNDTVESITFVDDGTGGDAVSGDGIYSYTFTSTEISGKYNVRAYSSGTTASSDSFERSAVATFTVSQADIAVSDTILEEGIDINQNAFYDLLRFTVPVQVSLDGSYRLVASLLDSNLETISLVNSGSLLLTSDTESITVDVPAEDIVNNGVPGPYTLHGIKISDGDSGLTITAAENYTTAVYEISDFEPKDTDKDGLPDALELAVGTLIDNPDSDGDGATDYEELAYGGDPTIYDPLTDSNPFVADTDSDGMTDGYEIKYGLNPLIDDTLLDLDGDGLSNIYEYENHLRPDKIDTDDDGRNDKWEIDNGRNPLVYDEYPRNDADIDLNAVINRLDLLILCSQWLAEPESPSADIAPQGGDGVVNFLDFAELAANWLEGTEQ